MRVEFTKMQGCGNDYIYIDCRTGGLPPAASEWAVRLSPRHFAVGADGVICICPPERPGSHATMRMFNADGSEGRMCGNGIRCVAQYLYTHGCPREQLRIDTPLDPAVPTKLLQRVGEGLWRVAMGGYRLAAAAIPAVGMGDGPLVDVPLQVEGRVWRVSCVNVGNPHCVTVVDRPVAELPLEQLGPAFEHHACFPERINTEFIRPIGKNELEMRVWERGSGETLACGTGACAAAVAGTALGLCEKDADIAIRLPGGTLTIRVSAEGEIFMTGPAVTAYSGSAEL